MLCSSRHLARLRLARPRRTPPPLARLCTPAAAPHSMSVAQPPWSPPVRTAPEPVLKVYNSLTRTKVGARFRYPAIGIS